MGKDAAKQKLTRSNSGVRKTRKKLVPNNTIRRQEERTLVQRFKVKKKRQLLKKMLKEENIEAESPYPILDNIKIEVDDILKDKDVAKAYSISPNEWEITSPIEIDATEEEYVQEIRMFKSKKSRIKVLCLYQNQEVAMRGIGSVQCLCSSVEINGYECNDSTISEKQSIYSPDSSSLLCIRDTTTLESCGENRREILLEKLKTIVQVHEHDDIQKFIHQTKGQLFSCVVFERLNDTLPVLVRTLNSYDEFETNEIKLLQKSNQAVLKTKSWKDVFDKSSMLMQSDCNCSIMICGGKDVGKSTLSRYTINRLLNKHSAVYYLECDCGQTEFTPPGVLSLVKVTKPLLGPPFTHETQPLRSFFYGHISPGNTPNEYVWLIELLFKYYVNKCDQAFPLVINQQGWVKGLGLSLLMDCIRIVNPCVILQMNSPLHESRNPPSDLTEEYIESQLGWSVHKDFKSLKERTHERIFMKIMGQPIRVANKNKALAARNLAITSYFAPLFGGRCQQPEESANNRIPPLLSSLQPYVIKWSDLAIHVVHEKVADDKMLLAFNLSFVCLCWVPLEFIRTSQEADVGDSPKYLNETPISEEVQCLGFGIVRNIDTKNKLFYILTPEAPETLQKVNTLLKGNVQLPQSYLLQDPRSIHPYYSYEFVSTSFKGAGVPNPRFNLKRRPSRNRLSFGDKSAKSSSKMAKV